MIHSRPPRDRFLLAAALVAFGLWLAAVRPARTWVSHAGIDADWAFGVAPSFFAGLTFVLWQAFAKRSRPLTSVVYAVVIIALAEVAQLVLPGYTADVWDVVAGVIGAALAAPIVRWRTKRTT